MRAITSVVSRKPVTQRDYARAGVITPQMEAVASTS